MAVTSWLIDKSAYVRFNSARLLTATSGAHASAAGWSGSPRSLGSSSATPCAPAETVENSSPFRRCP